MIEKSMTQKEMLEWKGATVGTLGTLGIFMTPRLSRSTLVDWSGKNTNHVKFPVPERKLEE